MTDKDTDTKEPTDVIDDDDKGTSDDSPDIDKVDDDSLKDLDEESKKIVKGFQKDYTKKTQALAEEKKDIENLKTRAKRADELENFLDTDPVVKEFNEYKAKKEAGELDDPVDDDDDVTADPKVKKLEKTVAKLQDELNQTVKAVGVSNKMVVDFNSEIQSKRYKDLSVTIDMRKVLQYAKENSMVDMRRAIDGCYADDIKEEEFSKRLAAEKETWTEQNKTTVLTDMPLGRRPIKLAKKRGST